MPEYTQFEKQIALTWAHAFLVKFDAANPDASGNERAKEFLDALDGGLSLALKFSREC